MQDRELRRISKKLAYILRHNPSKFGIRMDEEGWVSLEELEKKANISRSEVFQVIEKSKKRRFEIKDDKVRALYGHSVIKLKYEEVKPPPVLFHGTAEDKVPLILKEGLKPMRRHYVHLSISREDAEEVGRRHSPRPRILRILAVEAWRSGVKFYRAGDVYLSRYIPPEFIELD